MTAKPAADPAPAASPRNDAIDLPRFTFDSLYFCATPVEWFRGESFLVAVNEWYMPFIRAGWAVPLAFVIDTGTLLLRPGTGFRNRWKQTGVRADIKELALRYFQMLQTLRRQEIFVAMTELIKRAHDSSCQHHLVKLFLRFLFAQLSAREFRGTYSFNTRSLKVLAATPRPEGLRGLVVALDGRQVRGDFLLRDPSEIRRKHEFAPIVDLLGAITDYYLAHRLEEIITREGLLLAEFAAQSKSGVGRVDYQLLEELLRADSTEDVETVPPRPRMIEELIPIDTYKTDGSIGGYIDVNRKRFDGSVAELLPIEVAFWQNPHVMFHKMFNEGVLQYVRENFEFIEREMRVLFCFVIDVDHLMSRVPETVHHQLARGLTPSLRARTLAAVMIQDLARFLPRENVRVDFGLYLWSSRSPDSARAEIDLFAWSPEVAADRHRFLTGLIDQAPELFYHRIGRGESGRERSQMLDPNPARFIIRKSQGRVYHCRHLVFFTSSGSRRYAIPEENTRLLASDHTGDSILVIECDSHRVTFGISPPQDTDAAFFERDTGDFGQLSGERLRHQFLETVLMKGAGRAPRLDALERLDQPS